MIFVSIISIYHISVYDGRVEQCTSVHVARVSFAAQLMRWSLPSCCKSVLILKVVLPLQKVMLLLLLLALKLMLVLDHSPNSGFVLELPLLRSLCVGPGPDVASIC